MRILTPSLYQHLAEHRSSVCCTIYLPIHRAGREQQQDSLRLKNLVREADRQLSKKHDYNTRQRKEFLAPLQALLDHPVEWRGLGEALALFRSDEYFLTVPLPRPVDELLTINRVFQLRPLDDFINNDERCYILALSQRRARLIVAEADTTYDIPLDESRDHLRDILDLEKQTPSIQHHWTGQGTAFHGHGGFKDHKKNETTDFLRLVDSEVSALLHGDEAPLILAAADPLPGLFRSICSYPHLLKQHVKGNPDTLSDADLREKAWPLIRRIRRRKTASSILERLLRKKRGVSLRRPAKSLS